MNPKPPGKTVAQEQVIHHCKKIEKEFEGLT